jgi:hypothetical protein
LKNRRKLTRRPKQEKRRFDKSIYWKKRRKRINKYLKEGEGVKKWRSDDDASDDKSDE